MIETTNPTTPVIQGGATTWSQVAKTISVKTASTAASGIKNYQYCEATTNSANNCAWNNLASNVTSVSISTNGTKYIFFRAVSNAGRYSSASTSQTTMIDTTNPTIKVTVSGKVATLTLGDNIGVTGWKVVASQSTTPPSSWDSINSTTSIAKTYTATAAGNYRAWVKDASGRTAGVNFSIASSAFCSVALNKKWTFTYTGEIQTWTAPCNGTYKLEVYGAQGGNYENAVGGKGGYATGNKLINIDTKLYIAVGGQNKAYNGGSNFNYSNTSTIFGSGGGGATHIATVSGDLSTLSSNKNAILIVAGGGGGGAKISDLYDGSVHYQSGGAGGGMSGNDGTLASSLVNKVGMQIGKGGTQNSGGFSSNYSEYPIIRSSSFGLGAIPNANSQYSGGGGGGGYFGGGSGYQGASGGGGSGYIGGVSSGSMKNGVQSGDGVAYITLTAISN